MKRKDFLKRGIVGLGSIVAIPVLTTSCEETNENCPQTPDEIKGPFPIKTPADWVRENIIGNRAGIPLLIEFTIINSGDNCTPLSGVFVDLWHCDASGNYSEYDGQIDGDFTSEHFLRGRQTTDANGKASFISIYPGWYPGRAPHLHLEIKNSSGRSLLATQLAFPENISNEVYATNGYKGTFDTSNATDGSFSDSLDENMTTVSGNVTDGYTLTKTINVSD